MMKNLSVKCVSLIAVFAFIFEQKDIFGWWGRGYWGLPVAVYPVYPYGYLHYSPRTIVVEPEPPVIIHDQMPAPVTITGKSNEKKLKKLVCSTIHHMQFLIKKSGDQDKSTGVYGSAMKDFKEYYDLKRSMGSPEFQGDCPLIHDTVQEDTMSFEDQGHRHAVLCHTIQFFHINAHSTLFANGAYPKAYNLMISNQHRLKDHQEKFAEFRCPLESNMD